MACETSIPAAVIRDGGGLVCQTNTGLRQVRQLRHPIDSPAFRRWFAGSQVTDRQGRPLIVYHGTTNRFTHFREGFNPGFHFGTLTQAKNRLLDRLRFDRDSERIIMPAYLRIERPLISSFDIDSATATGIGAALQWMDEFNLLPEEYRPVLDDLLAGLKTLETSSDPRTAEYAIARSVLERHGFDGIFYENEVEGRGRSYIVFDPRQIKSVFNNGAFDPLCADILG